MSKDTWELLIAVAEQNPETRVLDLHGEWLENAKYEVDAFLERAYSQGEEVVKIVYGVGTGALAEQIPAYVGQHYTVAYAREALQHAGEAGSVVYAALKKK